jgi:peptide/nickel transport system substrate-binding protein
VPLLAVAVLLVSACGDDDQTVDQTTSTTAPVGASSSTPTSGGTSTSTPDDTCTADRKGGSVTMGTASPTQGLDPTIALGSGTAGGTEIAAIYDTLLTYDPATGEYKPHVAESLTPNADYTQWTLKLRPNIHFGNGDPLTTDAVRFSLERMKTAAVASAGTAAEIVQMDIVDDLTMVFHLAGPWGGFPYVLAEDAGNIVNPKVVDQLGPQAFNLAPKGAGVGPYEVDHFAPGEELVLKAKDDYWGGPVCIDTLRFVYVPGAQATYDAFNKDELQLAFLREPPVVAQALDAGVKGYSNVAGAGSVLLLNNGSKGTTPATRDVRVRQAVAHALDLDTLNDRVEDGTGLPSSALIPEQSLLYDGKKGPAYDPDQARSLVDQAKADGWDGKLHFLCGNTAEATDLSIGVKAMLEAVGMQVAVENLPAAELNQRAIFGADYDVACGGMSIFTESPIARLNQFQSVSPRNGVGYANPAMDAALEDLKRAAAIDQSKAALDEVQDVWNDTVPTMSLFSVQEYLAYKDEVHGLVFSRDTTVMFYDAYLQA